MTRRGLLLLAAGAAAALAPGPIRAQTPAAFEAASVKPNRGTGKRDRTRSIEPGRITYMDASLGELIATAYDVKRYQISGPDWIVSQSSAVSFDVVATTGKPVPPEELKRMLGPLLVERFHLAFHRETRELPAYALLAAKSGPKLQDPGDGGPSAISPLPDGSVSFRNYTVGSLADWLSLLPGVGRPVLDRSGVLGSFSFHANLFNVEKGAGPAAVKRAFVDSEAAETLRITLPEQLGLRLEGLKAPIEILVIDHADRAPAEN
jgi:uncharacterized protein (TIGR03435 family)